MTRKTVNDGQPFPGLLPAATFGFKRVAMNVTYMPESVVDRVTNSKKYDPSMQGVFFLQLKLDDQLGARVIAASHATRRGWRPPLQREPGRG